MPVLNPSPPAAPAGTFTALANFRAATTGRSCTVTINWLQSNGTPSAIKPTSTSTAVTDNTTGWTQAAVTDTAPSDATQATVTVNIANLAASEVHYVDCVGMFPGTVTVWTRGGLAGLTTVTVTRSDGIVVRNLDGAPVPAPGQQVTVNDYETVPDDTYTYTAVINADIGGATITSPDATVNATSPTPTTWWLTDPLEPSLTIPINVVGYPTTVHEQLTAHYPLGQKYPTVVADVVNGTSGQIQVETSTPTEWTTLKQTASDQRIKWLASPYGDGLYIRIGGASPTMGISGQVHQTQITPSTPTSPYRQVTLQYVGSARP